jgi:hypothetical protein
MFPCRGYSKNGWWWGLPEAYNKYNKHGFSGLLLNKALTKKLPSGRFDLMLYPIALAYNGKSS